MSDDKALFSAADKNKDGVLDITEYLSFSHPEEDPEMLPVVYKQTLSEKDKDSDGHINFEEFIGDRGLINHLLQQFGCQLCFIKVLK